MLRGNFKATIVASCMGYVTQAIMINFPPLLFVFFGKEFGLGLDEITILIASNFVVEIIVDVIASKYASKIGYRPLVICADIFASFGLIGMLLLPSIMSNAFVALMISMALCGIGGGLMEVLISPIVEACPTENKSAVMSLLHSFYSWGQVAVVLLSTVFFQIFAIENWEYMALIWTLVPLIDLILFIFVPINQLVEKGKECTFKELSKRRVFWVFVVMMLCAGCTELIMSQWASSFAENTLGVEKWLGDLLGPCMFALCMALARTFFGKMGDKLCLEKYLAISSSICIFSYLLAIISTLPVISLIGCAICGIGCGLLWPGTFSVASSREKNGGVLMFGLLALSGDFGCLVGPTIAGKAASLFGDDLRAGFAVGLIFPTILLIFSLILFNKKKRLKADK